jgi:hypothetical protein
MVPLLPLLVAIRVAQVPVARFDVYCTVMVVSAGPVMSNLSRPPDKTALLKLKVPEPLPPVVVNVKEVTELRTEPAVYSGL